MSQPTVLFVSHAEKQCGVYQFGRNTAAALANSTEYRFVYREVANEEQLLAVARESSPAAIIYNHHPSTLPWINRRIVRRLQVPQAGIVHEVTQSVADRADRAVFDYHVAPDPTLRLNNRIVFKTGRLLARYTNRQPEPEVTTVGCFGFGTAGKGFDKVVSRVHQEYDHAIIRLHMPLATFGDASGERVAAMERACRAIITKPGIELRVTHEFLSGPQLLDFLAGNTINAFFYEEQKGRGISSVIDHALAADRPIAVNRCSMFRHVLDASPSICIEDSSLREIIANGTAPLQPFRSQWTEANLVGDYERIVREMLARPLPFIARGWRDQSIGWSIRKCRKALHRGHRLITAANRKIHLSR